MRFFVHLFFCPFLYLRANSCCITVTIGPSSDLSCIVEAEEPRLSFSVSPDNNPCEEMEITVEGGTAPFQVTLLSVHEGLYGNSSSTSMTKQFRLTNIVAQNEDFHCAFSTSFFLCWSNIDNFVLPVFVTDSDGHHSEVLGPMISSLHSSSCRPIVTPPQISSSSGARDNIVVAIVGSVLAVLMILTGAYFWRRRTLVRLSKSEKAARSQFINETIERQNRYGGKELNALAMEGMLRPGVGDDSLPSPSSWTVSSKHSSLANYPVRTASDRFYTPGTTPVTQVNSLAHAGPMPPTSPISLNHRLSSIRPPTPVSRSPTSPIRPRTGSSRSGLADPEEFAFRF